MNKYDFVMVIKAENCNPNGDPLSEGRPRTNIGGYGEISAECVKRKLRNRLQDAGNDIFVQSDDRCEDGFKCLHERATSVGELEKALKNNEKEQVVDIACSRWIDVRLFGQLFAFSGGTSVGIRGAVSVCHSKSVAPVSVKDIQITKSTNSEPAKKGKGKSSDTMGCKYIIEDACYIVKGSVNPFMSEKNGVTEEDVNALKYAMTTLFENDESSARPSGSMDVLQVYWFSQDGKNYLPSAKIHNLVHVAEDGTAVVDNVPSGVKMELLV